MKISVITIRTVHMPFYDQALQNTAFWKYQVFYIKWLLSVKGSLGVEGSPAESKTKH